MKIKRKSQNLVKLPLDVEHLDTITFFYQNHKKLQKSKLLQRIAYRASNDWKKSGKILVIL